MRKFEKLLIVPVILATADWVAFIIDYRIGYSSLWTIFSLPVEAVGIICTVIGLFYYFFRLLVVRSVSAAILFNVYLFAALVAVWGFFIAVGYAVNVMS